MPVSDKLRTLIERVKMQIAYARWRVDQLDVPEPKSLEEREHEWYQELAGDVAEHLGEDRDFFDEVPTPPERRNND